MGRKNISDKTFDNIVKKLTNQFGEGYDTRGIANADPKSIPTGHDDLDFLLTKGSPGLYLGGIIELAGFEGVGKSSLALRAVGYAQRLGYKCCWFDAESAFDDSIARLNRCDPSLLIRPDLADTRAVKKDKEEGDNDPIGFFNAAEVMEMIYKTVCTNAFGLVVLDSVAGLMPERVLTDSFDGNAMGIAEVPRVMSQMLGKIAQACKKTETSVIFINQLRDQPGAYIQQEFYTPGGRALKFFAHQRIGLRKIGGADGKIFETNDAGKDELIGHYAKVVIIKNRKAPPVPDGTQIEIPIYYREYFPDNAKRCYDLARSMQVITSRSGILTFKDGDDEVFRLEGGESLVLSKIRADKLEARIAAACVAAESSEKNLDKKVPIKVNQSIKELAASYRNSDHKPEKSDKAEKPEKTKKTTK